MGHSIVTVAALLALASLLVAQKIASYISEVRFKKAHGCKPMARMPQWERILGYSFFQEQKRLAKNKGLVEASCKRYKEVGNTYSFSILGRVVINTIEPENIKTLLATNFNDFGLGHRIRSFGPLLGQGIFTSDGAQWEHSRALVRPNFTRTQVADLTTFETHIQHLISRIPRNGSTVDLQTLFFRLTMDSATEFLFGESVGSLSSEVDSEQLRFATAFDLAQNKISGRNRLGWLLFLSRDHEFDQACKTVHEFVDKIVYRALERVQILDAEKTIDDKSQEDRYVFLTELVRATKDPIRLRDELLNIFLAGRDTTASLLSHTFHVLARRPDIWKKLMAEVDELHGEKPDYETLRNMRYLKNLLTESLRLYPVVPANGRFANKATTLPIGGGPDGLSPVYVAKGQAVTYSVYVMHRRKDIYGPDADEFKPERWDQPSLRPGWGYLPFNGGPRICVGQQFALTEASYTIVRLLQEFGAIEDRDGGPWVEGLSLTMASGNGVKVAMVPK